MFAILGLRSLYFVLAGAIDYFRYLKVGLSIVLVFIGAKMLINHWHPIPTTFSLVVVKFTNPTFPVTNARNGPELPA